jgi:hypothetical protein
MVADDAPWYRDTTTRGLITRRYLPWLVLLSLVWELAQLPLYTIWSEGSPAYIAFAVVHCTLGDALIGVLSLALAFTLTGSRASRRWPLRSTALLTALTASAYTVFSEWTNTVVLRSWEYSDLMPRVQLGYIEIGLSPLIQWLVLPPLALYLAGRNNIAARRRNQERAPGP